MTESTSSRTYGTGFALLIGLFAWIGLMMAWALLEIDFSEGWKMGTVQPRTLSLQAWLAFGSALCLGMVWLLIQRSRKAVVMGWVFVVFCCVSQLALLWMFSTRNPLDVWTWLFLALAALFWAGVLAYLHVLHARQRLH